MDQVLELILRLVDLESETLISISTCMLEGLWRLG